MKKSFCISLVLVSAFLCLNGANKGKAPFFTQEHWVYNPITQITPAQAEEVIFLLEKGPFAFEGMERPNGMTLEKLNRSAPVGTPNYYAANAFDSQREKQDAYDVLLWLNTPFTDQDLLVYEFAFMRYTVDPSITEVPNILGNCLPSSMRSGGSIPAPYHNASVSWMGI